MTSAARSPGRAHLVPWVFNVALFIATLWLNLSIPAKPYIWPVTTADWRDYLRQSQMPVTSAEFFSPLPEAHFFPRPFTVPLFFKMAHGDPDRIIAMQQEVHSVSVFVLVCALMLVIRRPWVQMLLAAAIYTLMGWWHIVGWTILLLSESLSASFFFLWFASILVLIKYPNRWVFAAHLVIMVLFDFTRDTWPYIVAGFYGMTSVLCFLGRQPLRWKSAAALALSLVLFVFSQKAADRGQRCKLPVINTLLTRIIPDHDYYAWFADHGMPQGKKLKQEYSGIDDDYDASRGRAYPIYWDASYSNLFEWILKDGKSVYVKFMLTHPAYTLLLREPPNKLARIVACELPYAGPERYYSARLAQVFPLFPWWLTCLLSLLVAGVYLWDRDVALLMPALMVVFFVANAVLTYNADGFEVRRHMYMTQIAVELFGLIALAIIFDRAGLNRSRPAPGSGGPARPAGTVGGCL